MKLKPVLFLLLLFLIFSLTSCLGETTSPQDLSIQATALAIADATIDAIPTEINSVETGILTPTSSDSTDLSSNESTISKGVEYYGLSDFEDGMNPLTGLKVTDPSKLDRRPVAVKINNYPRSNRPQWGLSLADIVYEFYHNNSLPRFHAIFYGNDAELVGPIRSGRMFDRFLVENYETQFLFARADTHIINYFESLDAAPRYGYPMDGKCPPNPVCRYEPETLNYLLGDTAEVAEFNAGYGADDEKPVLDGMAFSFGIPIDGIDLQRLYLYYSYSAYSYWDYDERSGNYLRYQDQSEAIGEYPEEYAVLTDRLTGDEIRTENVVVLFIEHFHRFYKPGNATTPPSEIVDMNFSGIGDGFALRDGEIYAVKWIWEDSAEMMQITFDDGSPYPFKPGKTWFEIMSTESEIKKDINSWRVTFEMTPPSEEILWEWPSE